MQELLAQLQHELKIHARAARSSQHVARVLGVTVKDHELAIVMDEYPSSLSGAFEGKKNFYLA